jgi:hypothetical protein
VGKAHVSLVLPILMGRALSELADMLADSIARTGDAWRRFDDGDQSALEANILVLFGDCIRVPGTANLLRRSEERPVTVLWGTELLPQPGLDPDTLEAGYRAADREESVRLSDSGFARLGRSLVPRATQRRLRRWIIRRRILDLRRPDPQDAVTVEDEPREKSVLFRRLRSIENAKREGWLDLVLASSPEQAGTLTAFGIPARFPSIGYHPWMGESRDADRDLDVVFMGKVTPRRAAVLKTIKRSLRSRGRNVSVYGHGREAFGKERTAVLNRARISLNLHRLSGFWELPRPRILNAAACGSLIVTEPGPSMTPFEAGTHLASAPPSEMSEVLLHYLEHDAERQAIAAAAERLVTTEFTLDGMVANVLEEVRENSFGSASYDPSD